ncbi:hypothetical protein UlMin_025779 [Ulmus minor]
MNNKALVTKGPESEHHTRDGNQEGQGFSEEQEYWVNGDVKDVNNGNVKAAQEQSGRQRSQEPLIRWERFLPFRSLKVLLVENDDSTRLVVTALLRNCGYEVQAVESGTQAWKILEDVRNDIDIVLSEAVMPSISGIDLLSKIIKKTTCKDIPVIMMSSHDSRSTVVKCFSKGAVDFLVKPIRKNELKNLWQHVWRKCQLSSSTRKAADSDSSQPMSPDDQFADPCDSACAQVIHPRHKAFGNNWLSESAIREPVELDDEFDKEVMGKDLMIGMPSIPNLQVEDQHERGLINKEGTSGDKFSELNTKKDDEHPEKGELDLNNDKPNGELRNQVVDLMSVATNSIDPHIDSIVHDISNGVYKVANMNDKAIHDKKEIPFFEMLLKRPRDVQDTESSAQDRTVLRHSDLPSLSRDNSASTANQAPIGNVGSCSILDNSSDAGKKESAPNFQSDTNGTPPNQRSNGSSNNNNLVSTTNDASTKQVAFDKPTPKSAVNLHPCSDFRQVQNGQALLQPTIQGSSQCGSSNILRASLEGIVGNQSLKGSSSGSKNGSNEHNLSTDSLNSRGNKILSDNVVAGEGKTIARSEFGNINGVDGNRFDQREAALKRFRQKRQERCFEKKVRYQSRKKLAEQRPRIRGQFVPKAM